MKKVASRAYVWLIYLFLYLPILVLIVFSFNDSKSTAKFTGFTLHWYTDLFRDRDLLMAMLHTLEIALLASIIATVLGTAAAIGIRSMGKAGRSVMMNLTYLPVVNPEIVTGVSLMLLFVFLGGLLGFQQGFGTVLIAHVTFCTPYVILNVLPKLRQMDISQYEAAQDLGCSPGKAFFKAVIPQILPGIISGALMAFTFSLDDFMITYFTNGAGFETLPTMIFSMVRRRVSPKINALSTLIFVIVLLMLILINIKDIRREKRERKQEKRAV